ncbi:MAG: peptide ABC transporter substrate-binding protein [Termitinemataceae bacterium]
MQRKFHIFSLIVLGIALVAVSGCYTVQPAGNEKESTPSSVQKSEKREQAETRPGTEERDSSEGSAEDLFPDAQTRPVPSNKNELTIVFSASKLELDPRKSYFATEAQLFTGIYEGLFTYHPLTLEPIPGVAASYQLSDDKKTWTFTLRSDARYINGDPVRAQDFRDAWLSLIDPAKNSPYSSLFDLIEGAQDFRSGKNTDPAAVGIEARTDRTLIVHLRSPASFFPSMLCHHSFSPIHPAMLKIPDWSKQAILSNGPFYITEQTKDRMVLAKSREYWDAKRVALDRIIIRFSEDGDEAASLWNSGEARWVAGDVNLEALTDRSGITVNAMFATYYFYIRSSKAPWNNRLVRRALALVLPWEEIRKGYYLPAETLIYPISGYPKPQGLSKTNREEARALLAEAGFTDTSKIPPLTIKVSQSREAQRIAQLMAQAWKEQLGLQVAVVTVPYDSYLESLKNNDYEVGSSTWIGDFADPYTFLQMWRSGSNLNDAAYNDPEYEALLERSMREEGDQRWNTLAAAEDLLLQGGTVLPIAYTPALNIIDTSEIGGWFPNALDIHPFKYLYYAALKPLPGVAMNAIHETRKM